MSRGTRGQKEQRIFFAHWIGFLNFAKYARGVLKLRFELLPHFCSDFITAGVNSGADGGLQIARHGSEPKTHGACAFFDDALDGPSPSGVKNADRLVSFIHEYYGQAV